ELVGRIILPKERSSLVFFSPATHCAALAYASYECSGSQVSRVTLTYLGECYKHLRNAISNGPTSDVIYSIFVLIKLGFESTLSDWKVSHHLFGIYELLKRISVGPNRLGLRERQ